MQGTGHRAIAWRKSSCSGSNGNCVEVSTWRKSSYSGSNGGDCVEVATWRTSNHSAQDGNCVEVGGAGPTIVVRDTTDRAGAVLAFGPDSWRRFAATLKDADRA
jgi:hypothetical protein